MEFWKEAIRQNSCFDRNNNKFIETGFPFPISVLLLYPQVIHYPINKTRSNTWKPNDPLYPNWNPFLIQIPFESYPILREGQGVRPWNNDRKQ